MPSSLNNDERHYCVYCHTLRQDGRKYIGYTGQKPRKRWRYGSGYEDTYFGRAIRKYGWGAFEHEILIDGLTENEAKQEEIRLIAEYGTMDRSKGFNLTNGGEGVSGHRASPETIKKLRESHLGKKQSKETNEKRSRSIREYYKTHKYVSSPEQLKRLLEERKKIPGWKLSHRVSEETRQKLREINLGKRHTMETRLKMSESANKKAVKMLDLDGNIINSFRSTQEASAFLGKPKASSKISECANGKRKTAYNYKWEYYE